MQATDEYGLRAEWAGMRAEGERRADGIEALEAMRQRDEARARWLALLEDQRRETQRIALEEYKKRLYGRKARRARLCDFAIIWSAVVILMLLIGMTIGMSIMV